MIAVKLWLGDPDCGEDLPDRPQRSPCHPPDGPCVPMKRPGYPAKPKPAKKDFCFNCPPKRPCNLNKCPPDGCDGTCGKADFRRRNLLKLNSESQARSYMRSSVDSQTIRFCDTSAWTSNRSYHIQVHNLRGVEQQFCLSIDASKSQKKNPPDPSSHPIFSKFQSPEPEREAKVLYYTCPPIRKFPKLTECPKLLEVKPIFLTKFPECPKLVERKVDEVFVMIRELKCQSLSSSIAENATKKSASNSNYDAGKSYQPAASKGSSSVEGKATNFLSTSTGNGNRPHHNQLNNLCGVLRQFCSSSNGFKSPKNKSTKDTKCNDKPKPPKPPSRPTPPKLRTSETVKDPKVLYQKCPPVPKLPKLPECPKVLGVIPKCPPVPKLPKCPECPKLAKPKAKPEKGTKKSVSNSDCHADKSDSASKGSSTVKHASEPIDYPKGSYYCSTVSEKVDKNTAKKKCLWDKIRDATKREISTYTLKNPNSFKVPSSENKKRHLWTSSISCSSFSSKTDPPSSDSYPPWKSRKCKTVEEVCGEVVDPKLKALEFKPSYCPKNHNTTCYPEKPRCAEVKKLPGKKREKDQILAKKSSDYSGKSKDNCRPPTILEPAEKMEYKKTECVQIKLLKAGSCPAPPMSLTACKDATASKASSQPLPKPPAPPVHLCRCTPPPKLYPGSCPCSDNNESTTYILTEPCPAISKHSCPTSPVYYCPPIKDCEKKDKICQDYKKTTKP